MIVPLFILASLLAACHGSDSDHGVDYEIYPLRMKTGAGGHYIGGITCSSWRLAVETHNIIEWKTVPQECGEYVGNYMLGHKYRVDSKAVCREAYFYARSLHLIGDGKDIWIFDVDDTVLSSVPYYADNGFGVKPYNSNLWRKWVNRGVAPALPESLKLYNKLLSLGFKIVFLTGRHEDQWDVTAYNLKQAGFHTWEKLIVKSLAFKGKTVLTYKSAQRKELVDSGYRIIGNIGDQWSDILGAYAGNRTFKLPDPMYYIS